MPFIDVRDEIEPADSERILALRGRLGRDMVTGYTGIIQSIAFDLYGSPKALLVPGENFGGGKRFWEPRWCELGRLSVLQAKVEAREELAVKPVATEAPGGYEGNPEARAAMLQVKPAPVGESALDLETPRESPEDDRAAARER